MKNKRKEHISRLQLLRFNSLTGKTMLTQIILVISMVAVLYFFLNRAYQNHYRDNIVDSNFLILSAASEQLESTINSLDTHLEDIFRMRECRDLIVSGRLFENTQAINVTLELYRLAEQNKYIRNANIYVYGRGVMSSEPSIETEAMASMPEFLDYLKSIEKKNGESSGVFLYEDNAFLVRYFPEGKHLAAAWITLDRNELYQTFAQSFGNKNGDISSIYVYWNENPFFDNQMKYPERSEFSVIDEGENQKVYKLANQEGYLLSAQRANSEFQVLLVLNQDEIEMDAGAVIDNYLPALFIVMILAFIASIVLIHIVYRPMQQTLGSLVPQQDVSDLVKKQAYRNELELIQDIHKKDVEMQKTLSGMLGQVESAVTSRVLKAIIYEEISDVSYIQNVLAQSHSPFVVDGIYRVLLVQWQYRSDQVVVETEQYLNGVAVEVYAMRYWKEKALIQIIDEKVNRKIFVLNWKKEQSAKLINVQVEQFVSDIEAYFGETQIQIYTGIGKISGSMVYLPDSFKDAEKDLSRKKYFCNEQEERVRQSLYCQKVKKCLEILVEDPEKCREALLLLTGEIEENEHFERYEIGLIFNEIFEMFVHLRLECPNELRELITDILQKDERYLLREEMCRVVEFLRNTADVLHTAAANESVQYIELAKRYIDTHYIDSNLSLVSVSESCGISKGYLSRLFRQYTPDGIVEYLNELRVKHACNLLENTTYTVAEIGFSSGFNSVQSFIRVFKKMMGETPGQYRSGKAGEKL